jgi:hypothetical protein
MLAWMVDLLQCAGQLQEAEDVINMMPFETQVLFALPQCLQNSW